MMDTAITFETTTDSASYPQRYLKSCDACRTGKVRCLPDASSITGACYRCEKSNRSCTFSPVKKRKSRKGTQYRIAELEREILAMRQSWNVNEKSTTSSPQSSMEQANVPTQNTFAVSVDNKTAFEHTRVSNSGHEVKAEQFSSLGPDVVDRGILCEEEADALVIAYRTHMSHTYSGVMISQDVSSSSMRRSTPVLWLAVVAAAAQERAPELWAKLNQELRQILASFVFVDGSMSPELIQATFITLIFYNPPTQFSKHLFFQLADLAASMVIGLGFASKEPPAVHGLEYSVLSDNGATCLFEKSRCLLAAYIYSTGLSIRSRRTSVLPYSKWIDEVIRFLEKSEKLSDKRLSKWAQLAHIAEDTADCLGFKDASVSIVIPATRLSPILGNFEKKMKEWYVNLDVGVRNDALKLDYHSTLMTFHELVLAGGKHDAADFKKSHFTFPEITLDDGVRDDLYTAPSFAIISILECISSAHDSLKIVTDMSIDQLRRAPNVQLFRAFYALIILLRVWLYVFKHNLEDQIQPQNLQLDFFIDTLSMRLMTASDLGKYKIPAMWSSMLEKRAKRCYCQLRDCLTVHLSGRMSNNSDMNSRAAQIAGKKANEASYSSTGQPWTLDAQWSELSSTKNYPSPCEEGYETQRSQASSAPSDPTSAFMLSNAMSVPELNYSFPLEPLGFADFELEDIDNLIHQLMP
ncbi:conserved hypothetical protein [Talaromyces stipitatus ATCC 10500]|uniref:Zn(2)-C6 fungal-type domain-containing protein n=1 Tax=Talaromyces stipitatus (strain ATCC 10500 / CBS 375.48 / QM 6759 / NRRL 1006) TaxID=441959 RepID=B8LV94_TALSN|nr:uncharacterized protein TSTA_065970 [Talaromyces stipitatus ATCC 10500]EED23144.1 conserved hypothetical protein [Talaromyces stipitatus ATCC 10500]